MNGLNTYFLDNLLLVVFIFVVGSVLLSYVANLWICILFGILFYKRLFLL
jgi:hypothetical protein